MLFLAPQGELSGIQRMFGSKVYRRFVIVAGLFGVAIVAGILLTNSLTFAAPGQPIPFSHRVHTNTGIQCLFCHTGALRSSIAGIPSVQKCMGCHSIIATDQPAIKDLANYYEQNRPIPWTAVNHEPDFVYFSHQPHLGAGLNCEACHGNVGQMDSLHPIVRTDMGWCLNCHLKQPQDKVDRLTDCLACHK